MVAHQNDDHIMPKAIIFGGFGAGGLGAGKADRADCVPWSLPNGDKTYVQLAAGEESDTIVKPKAGTLYTWVRPLEKAAAQKGEKLTPPPPFPPPTTSYGKLEAKGAAGKHGFWVRATRWPS